MKTRYAVWGKDKTYRWLWLACMVTGIEAAKTRYAQHKAYTKKTLESKNERMD